MPVATGWSVSVPPTYRPVAVAEVREHSRVTTAQRPDAWIERAIDAATDYAEDAMGVCLAARTITATYEAGQELLLPRGPVLSITNVIDANNITTTSYRLATAGHSITLVPATSIASYPAAIVYRAGFAHPDGTETAEAIPAGIRHAILMHVGTFIETGESTTDKPRVAVPHALDDFYRRKSRQIGVA